MKFEKVKRMRNIEIKYARDMIKVLSVHGTGKRELGLVIQEKNKVLFSFPPKTGFHST